MSEVYGNSFVTILASAAQNSDQGFLGPRNSERHITTKYCPHPDVPEVWSYISWTWSTSERSDQAYRKISQRAWAFQEYSLPPRVLEYAPMQMEWHCNQIMFEETMSSLVDYQMYDTYKQLMWILSLPNISKIGMTGCVSKYVHSATGLEAPLNPKIPTHPEFAMDP